MHPPPYQVLHTEYGLSVTPRPRPVNRIGANPARSCRPRSPGRISGVVVLLEVIPVLPAGVPGDHDDVTVDAGLVGQAQSRGNDGPRLRAAEHAEPAEYGELPHDLGRVGADGEGECMGF